MFNLAPPPSWVSKALFRSWLSRVSLWPRGSRQGTGLIITTVVRGRGSHILRCHPFSLPLSSKLRGRLIMIKLYLQKLFVNEIGFMNQQMAGVCLIFGPHS